MRNLLIVALLFLCSSALGQEGKTPQTLFGSGTPLTIEDVGFFVAPAFGFTQLDGAPAALSSLRAGIGFGDKWSLGGIGMFSLNQVAPRSETVGNVYMDYWAVGGFAEYTLWAEKLIHLSFPFSLAYGEVQMDNELGSAGLGEANFVQIEPAALVEINLHKYVRLHVGASYRWVGAMTYRNFNQDALTGLTGQVGLKFGLFR